MAVRSDSFAPIDSFAPRHIGPDASSIASMLQTLGFDSLEALVDQAVPSHIRTSGALDVPPALSETEALQTLRGLAQQNEVRRTYLGMGYYDTITPAPILRNVFENPGWYTQYTPYQAEIAQGRLEALLNFQTLVSDLTGLPVAGASLLDEATAAAEAMALSRGVAKKNKDGDFFVATDCHPQTREVVATRAEALGIAVHEGDPETFDFSAVTLFGALLQYPGTDGRVVDLAKIIEKLRDAGTVVTLATDLLALCLLKPPGELGADIAVGSAQRLGVPLGYGGPHAAFMSVREAYKRQLPGRLVGMSRDAQGQPALRLAMQTREQHIRRERATSNICTAQVLLAVMASMYAVYHGPEGLRRIATRVHTLAQTLATALRTLGFNVGSERFFDTLRVSLHEQAKRQVLAAAEAAKLNLRDLGADGLGVSLDETTTGGDLRRLVEVFGAGVEGSPRVDLNAAANADVDFGALSRTSAYLTHSVFNSHHSETELMRYMHRLEARDLALNTSMIPLGSCTMKLNAASEMLPVSWPEFAKLHPFVPKAQAQGYQTLFTQLEKMIATLTGFAAVSLQPNAGSQGEYAGLLVIRAYHRERGDHHRTVCLIPESAHGTNPASAVMAGMKVVVVKCDDAGNIDVDDLEAKAEKHRDALAALMVTYPSTHGVFETEIKEICATMHRHGGQVYMDGANLNAQVGLTSPAVVGADVCHLNLHKTFAIPHGGGGPGMGPIAVAAHLAPYLPGHSVVATGGDKAIGALAAAPWGSPSILPISWMYMRMLGAEGMTRATQVAILNANYMAKRLEDHFPVLYRGEAGLVAHEFIIDLRPFKAAGVTVDDVAKRLMDYGFHAPTMSWPVAGTMMIEPTESESRGELDRFCDAMIAIRQEIEAVVQGEVTRDDSPLAHAPHTAQEVCSDTWNRTYSREQAAFPAPWVRESKYWPTVGRVDNAFGDRHLVCTCLPLEAYES